MSDEEVEKTGGCLCGAVRYAFTGDAELGVQCYCLDCQKISGAGNLPQYVIKRARLTLLGQPTVHRRKSAAGNDLEIAFCPDCGSPIYKATSMAQDLIMLTVGTLDDPSMFSPTHKPYQQTRQPWDES